MTKPKIEDKPYGFVWGPLEVTRLMSDDKQGSVVLGLQTAKGDLQLAVTRGGKMTIWLGADSSIEIRRYQ